MEETGITVFTGFAGSELLFETGRVAGVRTDDKGVDKSGEQKSNFEPGYDLKAKVVILAEGTRILAENNAPRIRASTDLDNVPMAAAFQRCGYIVFERQIDMTWDRLESAQPM